VFRKLIVGAAALAVGCTGLVAASAGVSGAMSPTITAGSGSHITCSITASIKLSPSLKNDWVKSDHSTDPVQAVKDIVDTTFAVNGPEVVALKGVGTCTGNVTDGINTAPVTSIKFTLNSDPAHPGAYEDPGGVGRLRRDLKRSIDAQPVRTGSDFEPRLH